MRTVTTEEITQPEASVTDEPKAATETNPVTEAVATPKDEELRLLDSIYESVVETITLRRKRDVIEDKLEAIEKEAAETREAYLASERNTRMLVESLPTHLLRLRDGIETDLESEPATEADVEPRIEPESKPAEWQKIATETITKDVPGLGAKKIEALCDEYPTLAELETARVRAANESKHFASVLPKGIGKTSADELESRLMKAQTGNDGPLVVEPRVEKAAIVPAETAIRRSGSEKMKPQTMDSVDPKHAQWCRSMAASLKANGTVESLTEDNEIWKDGWDCCQSGIPVSACPKREDGKETTQPDANQIKWLKGWVASSLSEDTEAEAAQDEAEEIEPEPEVNSEADQAETQEADEALLANIVDRVRQSGDTKSKSDTEAWNAGYAAGIDEQPIENCPNYPVQSSQTDWIRGWVEASEMSEIL